MRASLLLVSLSAVALAGCSVEASVGDEPTVAQSEIESVVAGNITGADAGETEVTCDGGDLPAEVGETRDCLVTLEGRSTGIRVTIEKVNDEDVDFSTVMFVTAEELATSVDDFYTGQGFTIDDVTCDGELVGEAGETARCDITSATDGDATVEATSTGAEGLTVNFDLEVVEGG